MTERTDASVQFHIGTAEKHSPLAAQVDPGALRDDIARTLPLLAAQLTPCSRANQL